MSEQYDYKTITELAVQKSQLARCVNMQPLLSKSASTPILHPDARKLANYDPINAATNENIARRLVAEKNLKITAADYAERLVVPFSLVKDAPSENFDIDAYMEGNISQLVANTMDGIILDGFTTFFTTGPTQAQKVEWVDAATTVEKIEELFHNLNSRGFSGKWLIVNSRQQAKLREVKDSTGNYIFGSSANGTDANILGANVLVVENDVMPANKIACLVDSRYMHMGVRLEGEVHKQKNLAAAAWEFLVEHRSGFTAILGDTNNDELGVCWLVDETA